MRRSVGEVEVGQLTIQHHQKSRRSIHDIRLNEYMNSNETCLVVLSNGQETQLWLV